MNHELTKMVNVQIKHTTALKRYQRAQEQMLTQIKLCAFDTSSLSNLDEWLVSIECTIMTLNKMAIAIDKNFEEGL
jgi:hypothetical protein